MSDDEHQPPPDAVLRRPREKRTRLEEALGRGIGQLHLDARSPGVLVPAHLRHRFDLVLNVSHRFDPPDLAVNDWGVRQTLSFAGSRFQVAIPWQSIYGVASLATRDFWMFADDVPRELTDGTGGSPPPFAPPAAAASSGAAVRGPLRALESPAPAVPSAEAGAPDEDGDGGDAEEAPRRPHLRVIK
jgi:stringent starvation protein B